MRILIDACCGTSGGGYDYTLKLLTNTNCIDNSIIFAEDKTLIELVNRKIQDESLNVIVKRRNRVFDHYGTEDLWRIVVIPILVLIYRPKLFLSISGVVSPFLFNVKKISMIHNILPFQQKFDEGWTVLDRIIFWYRRLLLGMSMHISDRIITFSQDSRDQLSAFVKEEKIFYAHHTSKFLSNKFCEKKQIADDQSMKQINIFVNSSCMPHKNLKNMLKGIILFSGVAGRKISVRVAGSVDNHRYVQSIDHWWSSLNVTEVVEFEFVGYLDDSKLEGFYRQADVCVAPSVVEIFDIGCLDSLILCGRVCVSDTNVHRELFDYLGGISFFDPFDPLSLCFALRDCLCVDRCDHLEILDRFSDWTKVTEANWELIYDDI